MIGKTAFTGSTDQPTDIDAFNINNYISGLCSFITDCPTPMTIAIQGDWGSGKTSVMEMVKKELDTNIHCVWFNTWQFSQFGTADTLSFSLFEYLIQGLEIKDNTQVDDFRETISQIGSVVASVGKRALLIGSDLLIGSTTTGELKEKLDKDKSKSDADRNKFTNEAISSLKNRFQNCINKAISEKGIDRIVIFIDDLDRLQPIRAVELLEVLKNFLDCENCVFILAIDYNVVVSGIADKYNTGINASKGRSFFDKIIQVPFKMPVAQYDISGFVEKAIEEVTGIKYEDNDIKKFVSLIESSVDRNPRSMKRLFNSYLLLLKVMDKEIPDKDSMSKKALFAILCMQQSFENLYDYIVLNSDDDSDNIDTEFLWQLAASDNDISALLKANGIKVKDDEAERIRVFMKSFISMISQDTSSESVSADDWEKVKKLLRCSSVTATETNSTGKKRATFVYNGDTYMAKGARKMNLSTLAFRMINDFSKETSMSAEEFIDKINSNIPCYYNDLKKERLGQVVDRSLVDSKPQSIKELLFSDINEIVRIGNKELLVSKGWGAWELLTLISILGYSDKVTSNVSLKDLG